MVCCWHRCLPANPGMPGMLAAAPHSMKGLTFKSKRKLKQKQIKECGNLTKTKQDKKLTENYLASRGYPPRRSLCLRCVKTAKETRVNFVVILLRQNSKIVEQMFSKGVTTPCETSVSPPRGHSAMGWTGCRPDKASELHTANFM